MASQPPPTDDKPNLVLVDGIEGLEVAAKVLIEADAALARTPAK